MSSVSKFSVGDSVYFKHPRHSWILGTVQTIEASTCSCKSDDSRRSAVGDIVPKLKCDTDVTHAMMNLIDENVPDLLQLTVLHESTLLRCLYLRYMSDVIYTNVGQIVVAFNPFTFTIPHYKDDQMARYLAAPPDGSDALMPHTWATAHITYFEMLQTLAPQFILVSGESGSGKTEASKIVVKYLSSISRGRGSADEDERSAQVGQKMQKCSPILESFGNAKTVRNDNSSRFGKFMKIQFSLPGTLLGSFTERYLLEKSRIVTAGPGERVYHSFYLLFRGIGKSYNFQLRPQTHYASINSGGVLANEDYDTEKDVTDVVESMKVVGLSDEAIRAAWRVPAGIVHFLNVRFVKDPQGNGCQVQSDSKDDIKGAATHWGVDFSQLATELVQSIIIIGKNEASLKYHNEVVAVDCRDALCKALYDRLFEWLVVQCNKLCDAPNPSEVAGWVGLLDIFGFEDFQTNSFEQLCINLANETLQGHYNTFVFEKDMEECRAEGIDTVDIPVPNNKPCLDLIGDTRKGIFSLLDDQSSMAQGSDTQFVDSCVTTHGGGNSPDFVVERTKKNCFSIKHYAGTVRYDCANWVEKNRDTLKDGLKSLLRSSTDEIIANLLDAPIDPNEKRGGKKAYVSTFFRQQLGQLMSIINASNPHWIRCVKPHPAKKPRMFDGVQAMSQLESSGVLGTVKIRKAGYPVRMIFSKFADRFLILSADFMKLPTSKRADERKAILGNEAKSRALTVEVLKLYSMNTNQFAQSGRTKLFMKADALTKLEQCRREFIDTCAIKIKRAGRGFEARKKTAREIFVQAAKRIVTEYQLYIKRSANVREERQRKLALVAKQSTESANDLTEKFVAAVNEAYVDVNVTRVPAIRSFLIAIEALLRNAIVSDEEKCRVVMFSRVASEFLLSHEALLRQLFVEKVTRERAYFFHHAYDVLLDDVAEEEDYARRKMMLDEERDISFSENKDLAATRRRVLNGHATAILPDIEREWREEGNANIWGPFFDGLFYFSFYQCDVAFRTQAKMLDLHEIETLRGEAVSEANLRFLLEAEEKAFRRLLSIFQEKSLASQRLDMFFRDEANERSKLTEIEDRRRSQSLNRTHEVLHTNVVAVLIFELAVEYAKKLAQREAKARSVLQFEFEHSFHYSMLRELQMDELRHRRTIWRNEAMSFSLLTDGRGDEGSIPHPRQLLERGAMWSQENHLRHVLSTIEVKVRHGIITKAVSEFRLLKREHKFRAMITAWAEVEFAEAVARLALALHQERCFKELSLSSELRAARTVDGRKVNPVGGSYKSAKERLLLEIHEILWRDLKGRN